MGQSQIYISKVMMCMASHVAPGYIPGVAHFWVQFSVSCVVSPPPAVRGRLLTRLHKQYNKERERRAMATVAKCYKLFHAIKTQNQTPLGTRHPSRVWFRDHHSPGLYWTSQTTPAVWDTVVSETLNPESLTDYQGSDYSSHEPTRLSDETIICSSFEQKSNFISQCNSNGYQDHSQGHNPAQRIPYIHWKKFYELLRWLLRDAPSCLPSAFSARVSP